MSLQYAGAQICLEARGPHTGPLYTATSQKRPPKCFCYFQCWGMAEAPHGALWTLPQFKRTYPHLSVNFWYWDIAGAPRGHKACSVIITGFWYTDVWFSVETHLHVIPNLYDFLSSVEFENFSNGQIWTLLTLYEQKQLKHPAKSLFLCFVEERKSYRFETTWGWVNVDPFRWMSHWWCRSDQLAQHCANHKLVVTGVNNCMISGLCYVGIAVPLKHTAVLHFGLF